MIQLLRVDHRLLHGQVAVSWVQGLGSNCIFCVGDKVANDPVWKTTLKMGKPAGCKLVIKDMEHAIEAINSGVTDKYKMIICVATIAEVLMQRRAGLTASSISMAEHQNLCMSCANI